MSAEPGPGPNAHLPPGPWYRRDLVMALLADLIRDELARLRPGLPLAGIEQEVGPATWLGQAPEPIDAARAPAASLDLDSLELLDLVTSLELRFACGRTLAAEHAPDPDSERTASLGEALMAGRNLGDWLEAIIAARTLDDSRIGFFTSGSTGTPKRVQHETALLQRELSHWAEVLNDRKRILRAVPCHHIYGFLFAVMLPGALGLDTLDLRGMPPLDVLRRARPGDLIVGHPGFFSLATRGGMQLAEDIVAVVSTAPCPLELWDALTAAGIARVLEIHGCSECAGIGWRCAGTEPFELLPWWRRSPGRNDRNNDLLLPADGPGQPCHAPDRLDWVDAHRFRLLGRRDGVIQIGGRNVFPDRVRRVLLEHPEVLDAAVRGFAIGAEQRLKAFAVPADPSADPLLLRRRLLAWLELRLPPLERPRRLDIGPALPTTPAGKPADW